MQTPSSPLHVVSSRFLRLECNHEHLFQPEYKRSNRTKGLKILRCFPHCCPEHIDRSYCGSSLSVRIRLAERPTRTVPSGPPSSEILSVFARFESVSDVSLRPGECVEVNIIEREVQTETHLDGQWIAGVLDRPSELVTTIRGAPNDDDSLSTGTSLVYNLNGKAFSRWYYDWESGANKAQRLMKHVLKAYVVERIAVDRDGKITTLSSREAFMQLYRVLQVVSSPEFTVISYRRAPMDQLQLAHAHAAVQLGKTYLPLHVTSEEMSPNNLRTSNEMHHRGVFNSVHHASVMPYARDDDVAAWSKLDSSRQIEIYEAEAKRRRRMYSNDQELMHPLEDKLFWEHSNAPAVALSKNMALLLAFVRWAPLRLYAPVVTELVHLVDQRILELLVPTNAKEPTKPNCFSRLLLQHAQIEESVRATGEGTTLPLGLKALLCVASQSVLWLHSQETCHWIREFFRQNATSVLDKKVMRSCFLHFLREIEERLNVEVLAATKLRRLSNVAEEVIAAVYSREWFHDRRPLVRQILSGQSFAGWNTFVAQMRDTYIGATSLPPLNRNVTFSAAFPPRNVVERSWHGEWHLDMDDVQWDVNEVRSSGDGGKSGADPRVPDVSLFSLVNLTSQIVRFEVAIDIRESAARVRAPQGLAGCVDCMHLVLDGKDRVYRTFPNGITSCGGDGACGDYVGEMCFEDRDQLVIFLEIFNWSLEHGTRSYHVRAKIECHNNGRLAVDGDILETTGSSTFPADKLSYVGEMSLRAKLESIEMASARQYDAVDVPRDTPAASWAEYGRFHLGYRKMSER